MKITHFLKTASLALMVCASTQLQAADVNLATAQNAAKSFLSKQVANGRLKAPAATNLQLVKAEASVARPTAVDYYIFNSDKSYVVIAGDDLAPEVLMYGEEGKLDMNNIPPAMQWLLNKYKYQIDGIKAGTLAPTKAARTATTPVAPMVTANWDQSAPYNNQCPSRDGVHALTGCPATSLAMCYYKWKWPETFPQVAAISASYGIEAEALPEREADWDNIIDEYTGPTNTTYNTTQANAVAWLMRYAGQAIPKYSYGFSSSGANDPEIYQGVLNMGYTDAKYLLLTELMGSSYNYYNGPQQYTDAEWNDYMMTELQNGRPIEYLAYDYTNRQLSGHAFNVFGCDANGKYYVNWGWSGDSNGYCTLHNFTTATGATGQSGSFVFNYGEAMIIGIEPPAGALTNPKIKTDSNILDMTTIVGHPTTTTFTVKGYNLTNAVELSMSGDNAFSLSTTNISIAQAQNGDGATITVTYNPTEFGTHEATITLSSNGASNVTVKLNGSATIQKEEVVLQEAANVANTSFKAVWTDETPAKNVDSYTLWVNVDEPVDVQLLGSIDASQYTGSYKIISLTAPWGGSKVYGGYNAIYFSNSGSPKGDITFTIPEGYNYETFSLRIKTVSGTYGAGNLTVMSEQTAAVGHNFDKDETYTWLVKGSAGEKITITSTDSYYSPEIAMIEAYYGDVTKLTSTTRTASEEGNATKRIITGITDKFYTVKDLTPKATYYFRVKANYVDGTMSEWSNVKQVTLSATQGMPGDVNNDGVVDVTDINILVNIVLGKDQASNYNGHAYVNDDDEVDVTDINMVVNIVLGKVNTTQSLH